METIPDSQFLDYLDRINPDNEIEPCASCGGESEGPYYGQPYCRHCAKDDIAENERDD